MKDITYQATIGRTTKNFTNKSNAQMWLAEEMHYAGIEHDPEMLARNIVNDGKEYIIKGKRFNITIR